MLVNQGAVIDCWLAIRDKDPHGLRRALARGVPVNHPVDDGGNTGLQYACSTGWVEGIAIMLAAGADPLATNKAGYIALHSAGMTGMREPMEMMLAQRGDVDARSTSGRTPLFVAAGAPRGDAVRALLAAGANPMLVCPAEGYTPVFSAALGIRTDSVKAFMEAGGEAAELLQTDEFWARVRTVFAPASAVGEEALARVRRVVTSHAMATAIGAAMGQGSETTSTARPSAGVSPL